MLCKVVVVCGNTDIPIFCEGMTETCFRWICEAGERREGAELWEVAAGLR